MDSFDSSPLPLFSRSLACAVVMGGLTVIALGCGDHLATVPVTGSVRVDGKPAGPIRVWPGGLNMARTLGDAEAGEAVAADPEASCCKHLSGALIS